MLLSRPADDWPAIFDAIVVPVFIISPGGNIRLANRAFCELVGRSSQELHGRPCAEITECGLGSRQQCILAQVAASGRSASIEFHAGQSGRLLRTTANPIVSGDRQVGEIVCVVRDVTAENELAASQADYRGLVEASQNLVWQCDADGRLTYLNKAWEQVHGRPIEQMLGRPFSDFQRTDVAARDAVEFARQMGSGKAVGYETTQIAADGRAIHLTMNAIACRDSKGRMVGMQGTADDITERKLARDAMLAMERKLAEAQRHESLGRMAAHIAHEINNPLAGIRNAFLLIRDAVDREHPYFGYVSRIEQEIDRIARIVRGMCDLRRPRIESAGLFNLADMLGNVIVLLESKARAAGVRVDIVRAVGQPNVVQAKGSLLQVMFNLLANAIDASTPGQAIDIGWEVNDSRIEIFVRDYGAGIDPSIRDRIFEPFFSTKTEREDDGMGLGLSISRDLAREMGGTLKLAERPAHGSLFRISLPNMK